MGNLRQRYRYRMPRAVVRKRLYGLNNPELVVLLPRQHEAVPWRRSRAIGTAPPRRTNWAAAAAAATTAPATGTMSPGRARIIHLRVVVAVASPIASPRLVVKLSLVHLESLQQFGQNDQFGTILAPKN